MRLGNVMLRQLYTLADVKALVALAMKPWPWLFAAVAVFSPHAPRIVEVVAGMAAR